MDMAANAIDLINEYFSSEVGKQCFRFLRQYCQLLINIQTI